MATHAQNRLRLDRVGEDDGARGIGPHKHTLTCLAYCRTVPILKGEPATGTARPGRVPKVTVGAEVWHLRHYEGIGFNTFTGDAIYVGPNIYVQISPNVFMMAAWNTQVAGHEVGPMGSLPLDLTDFSRHRAKIKLGLEFWRSGRSWNWSGAGRFRKCK